VGQVIMARTLPGTRQLCELHPHLCRYTLNAHHGEGRNSWHNPTWISTPREQPYCQENRSAPH
jgi:hypothetical protein